MSKGRPDPARNARREGITKVQDKAREAIEDLSKDEAKKNPQ